MTGLTLARSRARRLYPRSKAYQNTYVRGYLAGSKGRPRTACPYKDDPAKTWRQAWRRAWLRGHDSAVGPAAGEEAA